MNVGGTLPGKRFVAAVARAWWVLVVALAIAGQAVAQDLSPGDRFQDCALCPEMVVLPAGEFLMGSPSGEAEREDDEGPQHRVRIAQPFAVGVFEVTFAEWDACRQDGGCVSFADDEGWGRAERPVINESWDDAQAYVRWLSGKTGGQYRLPSEAEWEYAARAGTVTPFYFGTSISGRLANCCKDYGMTLPGGAFPANGFGLHDMHGNVWEWVQDCWNDSYGGAPSDGSAWQSGDCAKRVLRGGSWYVDPRNLRSANRFRYDSGFRGSDFGFRVARTLTP